MMVCTLDVPFKTMARDPAPDISGKGYSLENVLVPGRAALHVKTDNRTGSDAKSYAF